MRLLFQRFGWVPLVAAGAILFYAARDLPSMGDPAAPAAVHVSPRYIEEAQEETGAPNMVTAVLADYRSYDTLGETVVIFTAGLACLLVLGAFTRTGAGSGESDEGEMAYSFGSDVLDATIRMLTPFIVLFATYVVVHGHTSPGGGFQGGAILAALPLPYEGGHLRALGSLSIEVGVFIAVTAILVLIFDVLTAGAEDP